MEKRAGRCVPGESLGEEELEGSLLFIRPFKAVQSDMTPAFQSIASAQDTAGGNGGQEFVTKKRTKE